MKTLIIFFIVLISFGWIIYNLVRINVLNYEVFKNRLDYYTTFQIYTNPQRGRILDRYQKVIASQKEIIKIVLHKSKYNLLTEDQRKYLEKFLTNLNIKLPDLREIYVDKVVLKENPSFQEICFITENLLYLYGVEIYVDNKRYYEGSAFAFVTGFVNVPYKEDVEKDSSIQFYSEVGKAGLELQYDNLLRGKLGKVKYLMDPVGYPVKLLEEYPPEEGKDLITTLDKDLQIFSYDELKKLCDRLSLSNGQPVGGSVILMRTNGEVLVLVSYPSFNPNNLKPDSNQIIENYPGFSCYYNRAVMGEYPAASTFKIITSLAALEEKLINKNTHIYCGGVFFVGSHPFYCFNTYGHGSLDLVHALAVSCDVFYYTLGYKLGIEKIKKYSELMGLNSKTGIDLPFESSGFIPDKAWKMKYLGEQWTKGDDVNISIGQGFGLVTPIQMAVLTASVATGYRPVPFINSFKKPVLYKLPFDQKNLELVRKGMEEAINIGTATIIKQKVRKFKVAGKTGTAEVTPTSNNPKGLNNTWFVGYFGYQKPEYVIVVSLEASGGYGGQYAASLASSIISFLESKANR